MRVCCFCPPALRPKGTVLSYAAVAAHAAACVAAMDLRSDDVWGHIAPLHHVVDAFALWAVTAVRGRHVVLGPRFEPGAVLAAIERERITATNLASTMVRTHNLYIHVYLYR